LVEKSKNKKMNWIKSILKKKNVRRKTEKKVHCSITDQLEIDFKIMLWESEIIKTEKKDSIRE